jgi:hypothetical protein
LFANDGKPVRTLVTEEESGGKEFVNLQWSSDDRMVTYISVENYSSGHPEELKSEGQNLLYCQDVSTGKRWKLDDKVRLSAWIPNTHYVIYTSSARRGLFLINVNSGKPVRVLDAPVSSAVFVSPDAGRVAWLNGEKINGKNGKRLSVADVPSSESEMRKPSSWKPGGSVDLPDSPRGVGLSPDGQQVAAFVGVQLAVLSVDKGVGRLLGTVESASYPGMSVFDETPPGVDIKSTDVFVWRTTGRDVRWSANGQYLLMGDDEGRYLAVPVGSGPSTPIARLDWRSTKKASTITLYTCPRPKSSGECEVEWAEVN